ncbi:MAG: response regulator [Treponema sp.]|jgi:signal transduction histidine kinase/CheY-like chemotaxis protein|nr:response regulator [Treponema sp.]
MNRRLKITGAAVVFIIAAQAALLIMEITGIVSVNSGTAPVQMLIKSGLIVLGILLAAALVAVNIRVLSKIKAETAAKEQVIKANRDKSSFLARIGHEVRAPVNTILSVTGIQMRKETPDPELKEALDRIYSSGNFLLDIINDFLDLSKIEAGRLELVPVKYDTANLINDTVNLIVTRYNTRQVEFDLRIDGNIPSALFGDDLRIKHILNNLLSNAFKYTESGMVTLSVSADVTEAREEAVLALRVSDTGQGIASEHVEKLFDEYTRFNTDANRAVEGTGLGMSIVKHLVNLMNGTISVESEPGKGSVFTVHLPQKLAGGALLGRQAAENIRLYHKGNLSQIRELPKIIHEYMPYGRVLIVDDMEINLRVTEGLLAPYGLSVETAARSFKVIDKIKSGASYDIIFMDHYMPGIDGVETVKIIRELGYLKPIIALTANATAEQAEKFLSKGFDAYLLKPVDLRKLNAFLNKYIRDKYPVEVIDAARRQAALFRLE